MLNERLQILIRPDQRKRLETEARRRDISVAALVREAVDAQFGVVTRAERLDAVEQIRALHGQFLSPEALDALSDEESQRALDPIENPNTR